MSKMKFESFGLSPELMKSLNYLGYEHPTPVQEKAIPMLMEGHDALVQAPTGTGKTAAFGIPMIEKIEPHSKGIQALILSPTRELTLQTSGVLRELSSTKTGIRVLAIYGGEAIERQLQGLRRKPQIIVATPGRLLDHLQRKTIDLSQVTTVVLDEADQMLDMGFRPDLNRILGFLPKDRQTGLFSATLSSDIRSIAKSYQTKPQEVKVEQGAMTVDSVKQFYKEVGQQDKMDELVKLIKGEDFVLSLVFTNTKRMADRLARQMARNGIKTEALHGDMRQNARDRVMRQYRQGKLQALVATDVAARGIDVENVTAVINYDVPLDTEAYVHRVGRTGRAEETGLAYTFIFPYERDLLRRILQVTNAEIIPMEGTDPKDLRIDIEDPNGSQRGRGGRRTQGKRNYQNKGGGGPRRSGGNRNQGERSPSVSMGGEKAPMGSKPAGSGSGSSSKASTRPSRPTSARPAGARPAGAKPAGGKPASARPAGARPAGAKPAGGKPASSRPAGARPAGARPAGAKPAGGKPASARPASGKPASARPAGGKPAGGSSSGGAPKRSGSHSAGGQDQRGGGSRRGGSGQGGNRQSQGKSTNRGHGGGQSRGTGAPKKDS